MSQARFMLHQLPVPASIIIGVLLVWLSSGTPAHAVRDHGGWYTQERIANLRTNCETYDWARAERDRAVAAAQTYVKLDDEFIWQLVPGQKLPRAIDVSMNVVDGTRVRPGCPVCRNKIDVHGNYPYSPDILGKPWKLSCPSCKEVFPKNDFAKYYQSGIDERGVFDPEKADRSLLFNEEHPDPADALHKYGVDDGYGYFDEDGNRFLFIAYYNWKLWGFIRNALSALATAYVYTGEQQYAHKGLLLLDRIADVYPEYDIRPYQKMNYYHSGGGNGKVEGNIWETGVVTGFARSADMLLSGTREVPELYAFLAQKAARFEIGEKGTRELLVQHIDDGILREGAKAVIEGAARGNQGMHQRAIAACAMALDQDPETEQWLDWVFAPDGGAIPGVIVGSIDRDGVGAEAAPGYALGWGANIGTLADWIADYEGYTRNDIYRDFPSFARTFTAGWEVVVQGYSTPNIGDTGSTGAVGGRVAAGPAFIARGYKYLKRPEIALAAYYANGQSAEGLGRDIYSADPDWIAREVEQIAASVEMNPFEGGHNMAGYGLASVEFGWGKPATGLWMYYGRNGGHGHLDRLNFDIYYKGLCMLPDLGYPEFATRWPKREYFTNNTISHNTVIVNEVPQSTNWVGHPELFCQFDDFGAVRVDSREVYADVEKYQRTMAFVKIAEGQAYALDVFRVSGGNDHLYVLHGPPGDVVSEGLELTRQATGTYFGPEVPFAEQTPRGPKYGYSWLRDVERDTSPQEAFRVDWKAQAGWRGVTETDDIHLRYHNLAQLQDVALADGEPPQNKPGNPKTLRYLLAHRAGETLHSTFAGIIEPYTTTPAIRNVERLPVSGPDAESAVAVKVTLADDTVDYLVAGDSDTEVHQAADGLAFAGGIGWLRVRGGQVVKANLCRGTMLRLGDFGIELDAPGHSGTIARMDRDMEGKGYVWVETPLPTDGTLVGAQMIIDNDRQRNACYTIESVELDGGLSKVCLGDVSFIRGYVDANNYAGGYVYDFEEGAEFIIPHAVEVILTNEHSCSIRSTGSLELTLPQAGER